MTTAAPAGCRRGLHHAEWRAAPKALRCGWRVRRRLRLSRVEQFPWPAPSSGATAYRCQFERRRVAFVDFWPGFDTNTDRWFTRDWFTSNLHNVEVVDRAEDADVVVFSVFGQEHRRLIQNARKAAKLVFFTGENVRPPVGKVPLCISFDLLPDVPRTRHVRLPLWLFNKEVHDVIRLHEARLLGNSDVGVEGARRGFCSWVASNAAMYHASFRLSFVKTLSARYCEVACGGETLNNVGGPVKDKISFLKKHRFNIAFENASHPGYCTEKILHAFAAGCVPIYWGDPRISLKFGGVADFNPAAVISAHDFDSAESLIDYIAKVDNDPDLFASYLRQPILADIWYQRLRDWSAFCRGLTELIFCLDVAGTCKTLRNVRSTSIDFQHIP